MSKAEEGIRNVRDAVEAIDDDFEAHDQARQNLAATSAALAAARSELGRARADRDRAAASLEDEKKNLPDAQTAVAEARARWDRAVAAGLGVQTGQARTRSQSVPPLRALADLLQAHEAAVRTVAVSEGKIEQLKADLARLATDIEALEAGERDAADADAVARQAFDAAREQFDASRIGVDNAFVALDAVMAGPQVSAEVLKLFAESGRRPRSDFLRIVTRGRLDPLAARALEALRREFAPEAEVDAARDAITAAGVATQVAQVTKRLSTQRRPAMTQAILSVAYPILLKGSLEGAGGAIEPAKAADTVGLAQAIILKLNADNGPVAKFSDLLAGIALEEMKLNASRNMRNLFVSKIRADIAA